MHRQTITHAIAGLLMGLALGALAIGPAGCAGDFYVEASPDPDCPKPPPAEQPPAEPFEVYGIRLAPLVQTFDDGTVVIDRGRFYDLERSEPCTVQQLAGQPPRCLPLFVHDPKPGYFADQDCTLPVVIVDDCEHLPGYVLVSTSDGASCDLPSHLRPLAAAITKDVVYTVNAMGTCVGTTASALWPDSLVLTVGGIISVDKFVSVVSAEPVNP
jgi:hypothetical protein